MRLNSGRLALQVIGKHDEETGFLHGPTISAPLSYEMPMFRETKRWGEDEAWCVDLLRRGGKMFATGPHGFCYDRTGDPESHAFLATDEQLIGFGSAVFFDCGEFSVDVINGKREPGQIKKIPKPQLSAKDSPALRLLSSQ